MTVINSEAIVMVDVDDTLVIWGINYYLPSPDRIEIVDPYDQSIVYLIPHKRHVKLIQDYKARGYTVFVWSAAGYRWAEAVVKALELETHVDFIMSKPQKYVDDLHAAEILGDRVYIPFRPVVE